MELGVNASILKEISLQYIDGEIQKHKWGVMAVAVMKLELTVQKTENNLIAVVVLFFLQQQKKTRRIFVP